MKKINVKPHTRVVKGKKVPVKGHTRVVKSSGTTKRDYAQDLRNELIKEKYQKIDNVTVDPNGNVAIVLNDEFWRDWAGKQALDMGGTVVIKDGEYIIHPYVVFNRYGRMEYVEDDMEEWSNQLKYLFAKRPDLTHDLEYEVGIEDWEDDYGEVSAYVGLEHPLILPVNTKPERVYEELLEQADFIFELARQQLDMF